MHAYLDWDKILNLTSNICSTYLTNIQKDDLNLLSLIYERNGVIQTLWFGVFADKKSIEVYYGWL